MLTARQKEILNRMIPNTTQDKAALTIYPFRYEFIKEWDQQSYQSNQTIAFSGQILEPVKTLHFKGRAITRFKVMTEHQFVSCVMYNRPYFKNVYQEKDVSITGQFNDKHEFVIATLNLKPLSETVGIKPVYPLKKGIKQYEISRLIQKVLKEEKDQIKEMIPRSVGLKYDLFSTYDALNEIHHPTTQEGLSQAIKTLKYAEALRYQTALQFVRRADYEHRKPQRNFNETVISQVIQSLPFELSRDQRQSLSEIIEDIKQPWVMRRLLLGDVGSGKTIIAILSSLTLIEAGYQVAFLCPTEVLAMQHLESIKPFIPDCQLLTGSLKSFERQNVLDKLADGQCQMVVGTHALFSDDVVYQNLGYVIIDEQHRFGVYQRQKLIEKGQDVDVLMLSATPIPRTLAATLFSHLQISMIETMPVGRKEIVTQLIQENSLRSIVPELLNFVSQGQQVYVICPAIDDDNEMNVRNVETIASNLNNAFGNKIRIGAIHSRLSSDDIDSILTQFREHQLDLLVSTTIVEVGVHVETANMMIIYDADRFGLSQLHQLRGRVGRGRQQAYCYVLTQSNNPDSLDRLKIFTQETSGFKLAEYDLKMRGSGDLLGQRQSGYPQFTHLDLQNDLQLLELAKKDAQQLFDNPEKDVTIFLEQIQKQQQFLLNKASL